MKPFLYALLVFCFLAALVFPPVELWSLWASDYEFGGLVRRAAVVLHQSDREIGVVVRDGLHSAAQWRLLPALLPYPLAWQFLGAFAVLLFVVRRSGVIAAVVFGSAGWFAASLTWLGYSDSLLVLGLLAVAFAPRWWALAACVLTPWVDERFVVAYPLAVLCRFIDRREAKDATVDVFAATVGLVVAFAVVRLFLLPYRQNSADPFVYVEAFPPFAGGLGGAFAGLVTGWRFGWVFAFLGWWKLERIDRVFLLGAVGVVVLVGLATAQDSTRSMMLVAPAVLLGIERGVQYLGEKRTQFIFPALAATVLFPALLVIDDKAMNVNTWRGQRVMPDAEERILLRMWWRATYGTWKPFDRVDVSTPPRLNKSPQIDRNGADAGGPRRPAGAGGARGAPSLVRRGRVGINARGVIPNS